MVSESCVIGQQTATGKKNGLLCNPPTYCDATDGFLFDQMRAMEMFISAWMNWSFSSEGKNVMKHKHTWEKNGGEKAKKD